MVFENAISNYFHSVDRVRMWKRETEKCGKVYRRRSHRKLGQEFNVP